MLLENEISPKKVDDQLDREETMGQEGDDGSLGVGHRVAWCNTKGVEYLYYKVREG